MATLQLYDTLIVAIDGMLQHEERSVSLWSGIDRGAFRTRVTVSWAVPQGGLEFDGRPHIGSERTFRLSLFVFRSRLGMIPKEPDEKFAAENPTVAVVDARVRSFEIGKEPPEDWRPGRHGFAVATCVFEVPPPLTEP